MSLNKDSLKNDLISLFNAMAEDKTGNDRKFAKDLSKAVADYAESGSIATTDLGTIPSGTFTGSGNGSISVDSSIAENIIYAACVAMGSMSVGGDDYLALQIANGIQAMITAGEVTTTVTGTCTPPSGMPFPTGGQAKGIMTCVQAPLYASLKSAFISMQSMTSGGDKYMAEQISSAVDTYLKAGSITTNGQGTIAGSIGTGSMS